MRRVEYPGWSMTKVRAGGAAGLSSAQASQPTPARTATTITKKTLRMIFFSLEEDKRASTDFGKRFGFDDFRLKGARSAGPPGKRERTPSGRPPGRRRYGSAAATGTPGITPASFSALYTQMSWRSFTHA